MVDEKTTNDPPSRRWFALGRQIARTFVCTIIGLAVIVGWASMVLVHGNPPAVSFGEFVFASLAVPVTALAIVQMAQPARLTMAYYGIFGQAICLLGYLDDAGSHMDLKYSLATVVAVLAIAGVALFLMAFLCWVIATPNHTVGATEKAEQSNA